MEFILSVHAQDMLEERNIPEEWVWRTIDKHDWKTTDEKEAIHYFKNIAERDNRILHVVVNPDVSPKKVVTVFFDRRERKK